MSTYTFMHGWIFDQSRQALCFRAHFPDETLAHLAKGPRSAEWCKDALRAARLMLPAGSGVAVWRHTLVVARCPWLKPYWRVLGHVDDILTLKQVGGRPSLSLAIVPPSPTGWLRTIDALGPHVDLSVDKPQPTATRPAPADPMDRWMVWGPGIAHADTYAPLLSQIRPPGLDVEIAAALSAPPASPEACERAKLLLQLVLPPGHEPFVWRQRVAACRVAGARPAWRYLGRVDALTGVPRLDVVIVPVGSRWAGGCR